MGQGNDSGGSGGEASPQVHLVLEPPTDVCDLTTGCCPGLPRRQWTALTPCALAHTLRTVECPHFFPLGRPHLQEHVFRNTTVPHHLLNLNGYISTGHFNTFLRGNFFDSFAGEGS